MPCFSDPACGVGFDGGLSDGADIVIASGLRVRSCDVALALPPGSRGTATFTGSVRGQSLQRGGMLALSFIERPSGDILIERPSDRPPGLSGPVVRVSTAGMGLPVVQRFSCYDALGNPISAVNVVLR